jgi:hypothetical protein
MSRWEVLWSLGGDAGRLVCATKAEAETKKREVVANFYPYSNWSVTIQQYEGFQ